MMSKRTLTIDDRIYKYLHSVSVRESLILARLREETAADPLANMQIAPEQGQFMALLVDLLGSRRAIEIGTYTGYSALCIAMSMPEDGRLICCDTDEQRTSIARRYFAEAGVADRIKLRIAPALTTLDDLLEQGQASAFDFAFIDADKENYENYFERCMNLMRPGGLIAVDNTLWGGSVADPENQEPDAVAIRRFNKQRYNDKRISLALVPIGDGLTLARKLDA
ncbi:MAG TPA: class I SAM-dependent methyltransferase [Gammaproteobacteria bacterium]|nr:class I SAM-dependent methyltransferase [Gammaproteobacteria bacterium]